MKTTVNRIRGRGCTMAARLVSSRTSRTCGRDGAIPRYRLDRHDRSNRKKKDGWSRDSGKNTRKAVRKGLKKLTK